MKKLLNILYEIGLRIGQARTAAAMARAGMYTEAHALMDGKWDRFLSYRFTKREKVYIINT